jgi:hypothetical protein
VTRLCAGMGEGDLHGAFAHLAILAHELVHAAVQERAVAVLVDVHAVGRAGGSAVEERSEWDRLACPGR